MRFDMNDLQQGINDGFIRINRHFKFQPQKLSPPIEAILNRVLTTQQGQLNGRFVQLFAELTTIAVASRDEYREPALQEDEVRKFLDLSTTFFNSFTHK